MSFKDNREFERTSWHAWCEDCDFNHDGPHASEQARKHATLTGHTIRDTKTDHYLCNPVPRDDED